jgi:hypothetical protein
VREETITTLNSNFCILTEMKSNELASLIYGMRVNGFWMCQQNLAQPIKGFKTRQAIMLIHRKIINTKFISKAYVYRNM